MSAIISGLEKEYKNAKNTKGESVKFVFNVIGIQVDNPAPTKPSEINAISTKYGIQAQTPNKESFFESYGIAMASVVSQASPSSKGSKKGMLIELQDLNSETIGHEEGHTLGLTHDDKGGKYGIMHYPPYSLDPREVDIICEQAYERINN